MAYKFPNVSFDWLGELPQIADEAAGKKFRRETLADADLSTPEAMEKTATKLYSSGRLPEMEAALRLQNAAREKRALSHRISEDAQYRQYLPLIRQMLQQGGNEPTVVSPPSPAPDTQWGGPQGAIPGVSQAPQAPSTEVPPNMAASPSEELLARAEGVATPTPRGQQFAQAGGVPPPTAPPAPVPQLSSWAQGAQMQAVPARPQAGQQPTRQVPPAGTYGGAQGAAKAEADRLRDMLILMGPKAPQGMIQALSAQHRSALEKARLTPDQLNYEADQFQRESMGLKRQSLGDWTTAKETRKSDTEEVQKFFLDYHKGGKTARDTIRTLDRMDQIIADPNFISGKGAGLYGSAVSGLNTVMQIAKNLGVEIPEGAIKKKLDSITDPALKATALQDEYIALSNKLIFSTLGTLGNQISEGDRKFMERAFLSLGMTPEGNKALSKYLRQAAQFAEAESKDALEYRRRSKYDQNVPDMEEYVGARREERRLWTTPDGKLTPQGQEFANTIKELSPALPPAPQAPAAPTTRQMISPDTIIYDSRGRPHRMINGKPVPVGD